MKPRVILILITCLLAGNGAIATASELAVIVHPSVEDQIDKDFIARAFLDQAHRFPSGGRLVPINPGSESAVRERFERDVLERTPHQLRAFWSRKVFRGEGAPPRVVDDEEALLRLVSENREVITYIDASRVTNAVRVVARF